MELSKRLPILIALPGLFALLVGCTSMKPIVKNAKDPQTLQQAIRSGQAVQEGDHLRVKTHDGASHDLTVDAVEDDLLKGNADIKPSIEVSYDGPARFTPIEGTSFYQATNTESHVIRAGRKYYCAKPEAWYVASFPTGPWRIETELPEEIASSRPPPTSAIEIPIDEIASAKRTKISKGKTAALSGSGALLIIYISVPLLFVLAMGG